MMKKLMTIGKVLVLVLAISEVAFCALAVVLYTIQGMKANDPEGMFIALLMTIILMLPGAIFISIQMTKIKEKKRNSTKKAS